MATVETQREKRALSSLNMSIDALDLAKGATSVAPVRAAFDSASVLLTMIRDSMINKVDYVKLGLTCADVCEALNQGTDMGRVYRLNRSVLDAVEKLTLTTDGIQKNILKQSTRNVISRRYRAKDDKEAIASWGLDFERILRVFNTELGVDAYVVGTDAHQDAANKHTIVSEAHRDVQNTEAIASGVPRDILHAHPIVSNLRRESTDTRTIAFDTHHSGLKSPGGASAPGHLPLPPPLPRDGHSPPLQPRDRRLIASVVRDEVASVQTAISDIYRMLHSQEGADRKHLLIQYNASQPIPPLPLPENHTPAPPRFGTYPEQQSGPSSPVSNLVNAAPLSHTDYGQHPLINLEGVSEGEEPRVEEKVDETKHPEEGQLSEELETIAEPEDVLAIPGRPGSFATDYLLERLDKQLQPLASDSPGLVSLDAPARKRLIDRTFSPQGVTSLIEAIFMSKDEVEMVRDLRGDDAQTFIDVIHEALDLPDLRPRLRMACLSVLCRICGRWALLPRSLRIPICYNRFETPLYRGGFADVWKGEYQGRHVAVKVLRVYSTSDFVKIASRFCREVVTWESLRHPNVLSLLGITMSDDQFAMVSDWMENGNINEFIRAHKEANRFELLKDVASGLMYMHDQEMIHGDLKGVNILIDENGNARLADFGLLTIVSNPAYFTPSSSIVTCGTIRWMSPELLRPDRFGLKDSRPTKESDYYALGMVIYEVLSGKVPFAGLKDFIVIPKVVEGELPERPEGREGLWFTDDLWEMLNRCWATEPKSRPGVRAVSECLDQVSKTWKPPSQQIDEDVEPDEDDWNPSAVVLSNQLH